ncbi:hypothetical protein A0H81_02093 [Grifola frondosa]|uniref:Uncharacterized protein n=1 Tax=Grifola frondosa TaxID=5627 RepID=A0A1C7MME0_GRIFR|nr:hypothetical protein A0H81_02093 [Grifola frondosa]
MANRTRSANNVIAGPPAKKSRSPAKPEGAPSSMPTVEGNHHDGIEENSGRRSVQELSQVATVNNDNIITSAVHDDILDGELSDIDGASADDKTIEDILTVLDQHSATTPDTAREESAPTQAVNTVNDAPGDTTIDNTATEVVPQVMPIGHELVVNPGYFTPDVVAQLLTVISFEDMLNVYFSVSKVPISVSWGSTPTTAKYLCINNVPVSLSMAGVVRSVWFYTRAGIPVQRASIGITPCTLRDIAAAQRLLGEFAHPTYRTCATQCHHPWDSPRISEHENTTIYARKDQAIRTRGSQAATAKVFDKVFDATHGANASMRRILPSCVMVEDVVHLECRLLRYPRLDTAGKRGQWQDWVTQYELRRVNHLYAKPAEEEDTLDSGEDTDIVQGGPSVVIAN